MKTTKITLALAAAMLLSSACPTTTASCTADNDCGGNARCFIVDSAGVCSIVASANGPAVVAPPAQEPALPEDGDGAVVAGPLVIERGIVTGGGRVHSGGGFTLRGSITSSSSAASSTFRVSPRTVR